MSGEREIPKSYFSNEEIDEITRKISEPQNDFECETGVLPEFYTNEKPNETGWYYHQNSRGKDEIIFLDFTTLEGFFIRKISSTVVYLDNDKGRFGPRITLPNESNDPF